MGKKACKKISWGAPGTPQTRVVILRHRLGEIVLCFEVPILATDPQEFSFTRILTYPFSGFFSHQNRTKRDKNHPLRFPSFPVRRGKARSWDRTSLKTLSCMTFSNIFPPNFLEKEGTILRISLRGPMGNHCVSANFWMLKKAPPGVCRVPTFDHHRAGGIGRYPPVRSPTPEKPPDSETRQEVKKVLPLTVTCARDRHPWRAVEPRCPLDNWPTLSQHTQGKPEPLSQRPSPESYIQPPEPDKKKGGEHPESTGGVPRPNPGDRK